jgi:hypothetical protein
MQLQFKCANHNIVLDASNYGVDIFCNKKYVSTVGSGEKQTKIYWIERGIEYVITYKEIIHRSL